MINPFRVLLGDLVCGPRKEPQSEGVQDWFDNLQATVRSDPRAMKALWAGGSVCAKDGVVTHINGESV